MSESTQQQQGNWNEIWDEVESGGSPTPEATERGAIRAFFAEYWLWIVVPAVIVIALIAGLAIYINTISTNSANDGKPFEYTPH